MPGFLRKLLGRKPTPRMTDEDVDLEQFFTDAEHALQVFEQLVSAARMPKRLLVIHGVGGVGKSTVLKMYRLSCRRQRIPVALVGGEEAPSAVDMLADWTKDLSGDDVKLPTFQATLTHYRALQAKVEAKAKKTGQAMAKAAGELGKVAARTAVEMAASAIPVVGPLASALGGAGAEAFMDWLRGFLSKPELELYLDPTKRLTDNFLSDLTRAAARQRIVLMADTYEQMTTLADWIRDLARRLPENVLLVIAGRTMPEWDRAWPGWMGRAEIVELKEMTPDDLRTLVHRYYAHIRGGEPNPQQVEAIVQFARGLPMVATTVVQLWVKYGVEDFQAVRPQVVADLVDRLLEGVPLEMWPAFEVAAVLRYFNADSLRALLDGGDADRLYAELRRWPFIRPRRGGLAVHDTMREMMNEALRVRTPEGFRALHERAAVYYRARLEKATADKGERYTLEQIYHRVRADEEAGIRLFQEMAEELTRSRLVNRLRSLINDVNTYPLERENSRLWREYYNARLAHLEARWADAGKVYQAVGENECADPKLKAYALSDWGHLLRASHQHERSIPVLERSLSIVPIDSKLAFSLLELSRPLQRRGELDGSLAALEKARDFYAQSGDKYGLVYALNRLKYHYLNQGFIAKAEFYKRQGMEVFVSLSPEPLFLKKEILGVVGLAVAWAWFGRLSETERDLREALDIARHLGLVDDMRLTSNLGYVLGVQGKFEEADEYFSQSIATSERIVTPGFPMELWLSQPMGFRGNVLRRRGYFNEAEEELSRSLVYKRKAQDFNGIPELCVWLGKLYEAKALSDEAWVAHLSTAESHHRQCLGLRWLGRRNFESGALTGLVRVKHAQGDYAAIPPLLTEAEQLAQQYEYNDHLASLRLTQGHIAWEGHIPEWGSGFDAALHHYQQARIYALRYNRFLLDEVLWGGRVATPLLPIIPHCLERGEEGRRMLIALRDWWQTGVNDIGTPRPDTISPIPEGIPLLEAERIAREREPGDGSPQKTVIEQIEAALR